jgi:hypothetical protein
MSTSDTNPGVSQHNRDMLEDLQPREVLERQDDPVLLHVDEQVAT